MMKTLRWFGLLAGICLLMPALVSCDNDGDEPKNVEAVIGTYSGSLGWKVMTSEDVFPESYEIKIAKDKELDEVAVVLPECSFTIPNTDRRHTIPSLTINGVDVKAAGNVYAVSEDDFKVTVGETEYIGSISGTVAGKDAKISYSLQPGSMPMVINFTFTGTSK